MDHGNVSPELARRIKTLRERINDAKIPSSVVDKTLNIATWNIREFGRRRRTAAAIHYLAEILSQFDVIAIIELRDDLTDLQRVMEILGPYWKVLFSDFNTDRAGNRERIGYLYDGRVVAPTGLAAEADPPKRKDKKTGEYLPTITWWRSPYMVSFRAGNFDFILLSVHIRWDKDNEESRKKELQLLADWINKRSKEKTVVDHDIIVMGDFNIPRVGDELFQAVTSKGLEIPRALLGVDHGSNLARDKRYDQILHLSRYTTLDADKGGALDFFRNNWRVLFPADEFPDMTKSKFTYELSDHLPLWMQIDTWTADEELDQIIRG